MPTLIGGLLILSGALVPTARAEEVPLPPVAITFAPIVVAPHVYTTNEIIAAVIETEKKYNLDNTFYYTLKCESGDWHNIQSEIPNASGPNGREDSWGIPQIHMPAHLEITREMALDVPWAIDWAGQMFAAGKQSMWTCYNEMQR